MLGSLKNYISQRIDLIKYEGIQLLVGVLSDILAKFLLLLFCVLTMILGSIALALWIGNYYGNYAFGFAVMTGVYSTFVIISVMFCRTLLDRFLKDFLTWSIFRKSNGGDS